MPTAASDAAISPAITAVSAVTRCSASAAAACSGVVQNSFALQPLSLQGQTGVNVSGGVVGFDLEPVASSATRRSAIIAATTKRPG